jgi:hypothetical protein
MLSRCWYCAWPGVGFTGNRKQFILFMSPEYCLAHLSTHNSNDGVIIRVNEFTNEKF